MLKAYRCPVMVYLKASSEYEAREMVLNRVAEYFDKAIVFPAEEHVERIELRHKQVSRSSGKSIRKRRERR